MIKRKAFSWPAVGFMILAAALEAPAQWSSLKPLLQSDVQIVTETKARLVLYHQAAGDSLILTPTLEHDADIYGAFEVKRGGNPYRVWVATEKFFNNPHFAGAGGQKFFRDTFLKTLRQDEPLAANRLGAAAAPDSGVARFEEAGVTEVPVENLKTALAAADSLPAGEKKDSLQIALKLSRQAEQPAETILTPRFSFPNARRKSSAGKRGTGSGNMARAIPPPSGAFPAPALLDSLYRSALVAMGEADWREAAFNLEKIQLLKPNYREVVDLLARVRVNLAAAGKPGGAATPPPNGGPSVFVGGAVAALGVFIALIVLPFIGVVLISPTARVRYHVFRGHYAAAAQIYERLLARRPHRKKLYPALASLYLRLGRRDEAALKVYEIALQLDLADRSREEINAIVSNNYLTKGRTDARALEVLEDALKAERLKQKKRKSQG